MAPRTGCQLGGAGVPGSRRKILFKRCRGTEGQSDAAMPISCYSNANHRNMVVQGTGFPIASGFPAYTAAVRQTRSPIPMDQFPYVHASQETRTSIRLDQDLCIPAVRERWRPITMDLCTSVPPSLSNKFLRGPKLPRPFDNEFECRCLLSTPVNLEL